MRTLNCDVHLSELQDILEYAKQAIWVEDPATGKLKATDEAVFYAILDLEQEIGEWLEEPHYSYNLRITSQN